MAQIRQNTNNLLQQVTIRHAGQADLIDLEWDGVYRHFRRLYQDIYHSTTRGDAVMWLIELSGRKIIGQLFVQFHSNRPELADGNRRAYLYSFRIQPDFRRQGLGRYLLQQVEDDLRARGYKIAVLNVNRDNYDALEFYKRLGYQVIATEPGVWSYLNDQGQLCWVEEPAWRMEKTL
jgi:ribosomal protein S18 acetylase RimI-like enzyme